MTGEGYRHGATGYLELGEVVLHLDDRVIFPVGRVIERIVSVPVGKNVVGVARRS